MDHWYFEVQKVSRFVQILAFGYWALRFGLAQQKAVARVNVGTWDRYFKVHKVSRFVQILAQ